ncbi:MAG: hypothetical protein R3A12_09070 [Ignavibacteria bacterium]|nr:hypothetical protein [Ignavibacteriota bacterium]
MKDSKLFQLLKTFTKEEFKDFEKFVSSAYFLKRADVKQLFLIVKIFYPDFKAEDLNYKNIHKKLYPGKKYNGSVLRKILSGLYKMAEDFLRVKITERMPLVQIEIMNEFGRRKLDKLFYLRYKELTKYFNELEEKDRDYFLYKAQMELSLINFKLGKGDQLSIVSNVNHQGKYLIYYFLIRILSIAQDMQVNRNLYNAEFEFDHIENLIANLDFKKIIENLKTAKDKDSKIPEVYYYIYLAYSDFENDKHYYKGRDLFFSRYRSFSKHEKYNISLFLENCCTRKIINGNDKFIEEVFNLYKRILKENLFVMNDDDHIGADIFRNIVITGMKLREFKWTEKFIRKYKNFLPPGQIENLYNYGMARLKIEKGDFETSLNFISRMKLDYFLFKNDVKNMQLRIYYELGYYEEALSTIDTYKHFLNKNNKVSDLNRRSNLNFIKYYSVLLKHKTAGKKKIDLSFHLNTLIKTRIIGNKLWLTEKFNEILM